MATQNFKRRKINNHLADRKRTRASKDPAIITPLSDKQTSNRAEEALRQSEERYRTLVEESFDGIFVQKGLKIIFANRRFYEMLGYVNGELEGLDHWLVYHPDYRELTRERAKARMRGENVTPQYEVKLQRKDGSSFDGEINARRIMLGNEPGIQVWVKDITERKNNDEKYFRQSKLLDGVNKVLIEALTCQTDEEIANKCLNVAQVLTKSKFGFIGEINPTGRFDTIALSDPGWGACQIPRSDSVLLINNMEVRGIWANVLKEERSLIVNDPAAHPNRVGTPEGHPCATRLHERWREVLRGRHAGEGPKPPQAAVVKSHGGER